MKDANSSTQLDHQSKHKKPPAPSEQTGKHEGDARGREEEKLPENRDKLGVNEEHRTSEMERDKRGTFP